MTFGPMPRMMYSPTAAQTHNRGAFGRPFPSQARDAHLPQPPRSVCEAASTYLTAQANRLSAQNKDAAAFYLTSFCDLFGSCTIAEAKQYQLEYWLFEHPEWKSAHTRGNAQKWVVTCFRWLWKNDLIDRCPYRAISNGPLLPRKAILPSEYRAMLAAAKACDGISRRKRPSRFAFRKLLWFMWECGCRPTEAREMLWESVDLERGCIVLEQHKTAKVTGDLRIIPLTDAAIRLLRWELRRRQPMPGDHVFVTSRGGPWSKSNLVKLFAEYATLAGVRQNITAYCLRHGFVTEALEGGDDHEALTEREVADIVGHRSTRYVEWYSRTLRTKVDYLRRCAAKAKGR